MDLHGLMWFPAYLRSTHTHIGMDGTVGKKLELLIRTREEDYQELSNKITQVNKQLNVRMDALIARFEELNQKILVVTSKLHTTRK